MWLCCCRKEGTHSGCAWLVCELQHARGQTSAGLESALLARQRADGSWPGGTPWTFKVPGTGGSVIWKAVDAMSIVATSLGLMALSR